MGELLNTGKFKIYEADSNIGVLIFTGIGGTLDGYKGKYTTIAHNIINRLNASVFIFSVESWNEFDSLITYAMDIVKKYYNAIDIPNYKIYAMGTSAGASFLVSNSYKFECIKKVLSINPVVHINYNKLLDGVKKMKGKVFFIFGEQDPSTKFIPLIEKQNYTNAQIEIIADADHQFTRHFDLFLELPFKYLFN